MLILKKQTKVEVKIWIRRKRHSRDFFDPALNGIELTGTILQNYFGQQSPMHERELSMQLGWTRSCKPPVKIQMHNPGRIHWRSAGTYTSL